MASGPCQGWGWGWGRGRRAPHHHPAGAGQGRGRAALRGNSTGAGGQRWSLYLQTQIQSTAAHRAQPLTLSVCPMVLPSVCSPAPQRRGAQPQGAAAVARPPRAQRAAGWAWASSWGQGAQLPAPRAPRLQPLTQPRVLGAGSAPTPQPPVAGPGTEPEGLLVPSPFPSCIPGCGASALGSYLLLQPLRAGGGPHGTPAPLSCLLGAVLGAAHHLAPPRLWGRGETEPTRSWGLGAPQCRPRVGAGLGRRRAPSSPGTRQPGGGWGEAALLGLKLGEAGGGRGEVPGLPAGLLGPIVGVQVVNHRLDEVRSGAVTAQVPCPNLKIQHREGEKQGRNAIVNGAQ